MPVDYHDLIKSPEDLKKEEMEKSKAETERYASMKLVDQWRKHPNTRELVSEIEKQIIVITDQCEMEAMSASCSNAKIQLDVVRIKTLKEVLQLIGK